MEDPTDLIGQEDEADQRTKQQELKRAREVNDLRAVMGTVQGRRFVWRLLAKCGVYRSSFDPDVAVMARGEGMRIVGLDLLNAVLESCPEQQLRMMREQLTSDATDEQ